jgi:hypothetical protein
VLYQLSYLAATADPSVSAPLVLGPVEADGAEVVGSYLFDLVASGLDGCDLDDERHEGLGAECDLHPDPANVWA